jgi:hypothetical protein
LKQVPGRRSAGFFSGSQRISATLFLWNDR